MNRQRTTLALMVLIGFSAQMIKGMEKEESVEKRIEQEFMQRGEITVDLAISEQIPVGKVEETPGNENVPLFGGRHPLDGEAGTGMNLGQSASSPQSSPQASPRSEGSSVEKVEQILPKPTEKETEAFKRAHIGKPSLIDSVNKNVKAKLAWARNNKLKAALIVEGVALALDATQATGKALYKWYAKNEAFSPVKVAQEMYHVKGAKALYHAAQKAFRRA